MYGEILLRAASVDDRPAIERLLTELQLPVAGIPQWISQFWIAESDRKVVGVAGVELYGDGALLRSVAVDPAWRSSGLGRALVERALDAARQAGAHDVFLLTTTAEGYFPRLGFVGIGRDKVPTGVQSSVEFREACPASAVVMRRSL